MVVVEPNIDDGASTIDDDASSILVDFSDYGQKSAPPQAAATPTHDDFAIKQQQQLQQREMQQQQEQQYAYIQRLLREIEQLRAQLDRLSLEVGFNSFLTAIVIAINYFLIL